MPDLISHFGSGYLAGARLQRHWLALFLFAVLLPDLATRPFYILWPGVYWFVKPFHTPLGLLCLSLIFSGLFVRAQRRRAFLVLLGGCALHLLFDLLQKHQHGGYPLLFPFSWQPYGFALFWPEELLYLMPLWLPVIAAVWWYRRRRRL